MQNQVATRLLGDFQVESGKVRVSDPCYQPDTWCAKTLENVKRGKWFAEADIGGLSGWGQRVFALRCYHESVSRPHLMEREVESNDIGVDSGQAGVFDHSHFKEDLDAVEFKRQYKEAICPEEPWYSMCCDITLSKMAGTIPFGVVSSSGVGDGSYVCEVARKDGEICLIEVDFGLKEKEDDEDDEEDDEEEEHQDSSRDGV